MLVKEVRPHIIRKGSKVGKIFLPEDWIGKKVVVYLHSEGKGNIVRDALKGVEVDEDIS